MVVVFMEEGGEVHLSAMFMVPTLVHGGLRLSQSQFRLVFLCFCFPP